MDLIFIAFVVYCLSWCLIPVSYAYIPDPFQHPSERLHIQRYPALIGIVSVNGKKKALVDCGALQASVGEGECLAGWCVTKIHDDGIVVSDGTTQEKLLVEH